MKSRKSNKPPDPAFRFWSSPQTWPLIDPGGYVFLARAVLEIGRAKFAAGDDAWTGDEPTARHERRLVVLRPKQAPEKRPAVSEIEKCRQRFLKVQAAIVQACTIGELVAAYRHDGVWITIPAKHWNTEHWASAFVRCKYRPGNAFSNWYDGSNYEPIYLTRESLNAFISGHAAPGLTRKDSQAPNSSTAARRTSPAKDALAFQQWYAQQTKERGLPPSMKGAEQFAKDMNRTRDWAREMMRGIPQEQRRSRGGQKRRPDPRR